MHHILSLNNLYIHTVSITIYSNRKCYSIYVIRFTVVTLLTVVTGLTDIIQRELGKFWSLKKKDLKHLDLSRLFLRTKFSVKHIE